MASAWRFYDKAKDYIGTGTINLSADQFYIAILSGGAAATISNSARSTWTSLTAAALAASFPKKGRSINAVWSGGSSSGAMRFHTSASHNVIFTASGAALSNVQYAVCHASGGQLLCWSKLSSAAFDVTTSNTLTITPSATGIFELA